MSGNAIFALAGGVGGAKLADGLSQRLGHKLTVIVNTGDDFEHLGFRISPDLDTVMYTLAGLAHKEQGWGIENDSWDFMEQLTKLGGPTWFRLGDKDLATHVIRTNSLRAGMTLSAVTELLCELLGVRSRIMPMSDDPVRTVIQSTEEAFSFQEYFVKHACRIPVTRLRYEGAVSACLNPKLAHLSPSDSPSAVVICPSNPYLSIDPILAVPGTREWLSKLGVPIIAVSPIVAGAAIKGPAAKIMAELGISASATAVAEHYSGIIRGIVIDRADAALVEEIESRGLVVKVAQTVMKSAADRLVLADECLSFAQALTT